MLRYHFKFYLRPVRASHVIYYDFTLNSKRSVKSTGHEVHPKYWDKKGQQVKDGHVRADEINKSLAAIRENLISPIINSQLTGKPVTATDTVIKSFVEDYIGKIKRADNTIIRYNQVLGKLEAFSPGVKFNDVDVAFLDNFHKYIRGAGVEHRKANSTYFVMIISTLRAWFNAARKRGITENYPFKNYDTPSYKAEEKDYLTMDEITAWTELVNESKGNKQIIGNYFLLGCYTGLRISDLTRFDSGRVVNGEIRLWAKKNGSFVSMPIHTHLQAVLRQLKPFPMTEQGASRILKNLAAELRLNKNIGWHCSRKTFAVTMCLDRGISSETAAELMGITLAVFIRSYSRVTPEKIKKEALSAWAGL